MGKLFLISGNDEFCVKEKSGELLREICGDPPEENPDLEIVRGDDEADKPYEPLDRFVAAISTPPFLSPTKIVWLKHYAHFQSGKEKSKADPAKDARLEAIADFVKAGFPDDLTLIIDGPGLDRRKTFTKVCEKAAQISGGALHWLDKADARRGDKTYAANLQRRVREMAADAGKRIAPDAAAFIAETIGSDSGRLRSEMDKLCAYAGDAKSIALSDCIEICSRTSETVSWEFSSALAERNLSKAMSLIPSLLEHLEQERGGSGRVEMAVVGAVASEFEKLLSVKRAASRVGIPKSANADYFYNLFASRKDDEDKAGGFFSLHPFRAYKMWENSSRFKDADLASAFEAIFEANLAIVTGGDPKMTLEQMAIKVAAR